jgi:hypothetical protein
MRPHWINAPSREEPAQESDVRDRISTGMPARQGRPPRAAAAGLSGKTRRRRAATESGAPTLVARRG